MTNELQIFCSLPKCEKDTECIDCEYMVKEKPKKRMTNEEAIEILEDDIEICTIQQKEAVDMAIKALDSWDKYSSELWKRAYDRGFKDGVSEGIKAME